MKVDGEGFDALNRIIGQASQALPGRKPGKSMQNELAEKARQVAEFLKAVVLRIGSAVSSAPKSAISPAIKLSVNP